MIQTIYVIQKYEDPKAVSLTKLLSPFTKPPLKIKTAKVYRLEGITKSEAKKLADILFSESLTQNMTQNASPFSEKIQFEIAYKMGVMNPETASIIKSAYDLGIHPKAADSSFLYAISSVLSKENLKTIFKDLHLFNELTEEVREEKPSTLLIKGHVGKTEIIPIRNMNTDQLLALSKGTLFLDEAEMKTIKMYFKKIDRDPTDCELEVLAQTWSEHCIHKTFKASLVIDGKRKRPFFTRIKQTATYNKTHIVSAFSDNSGVIDFYDGYAICGKVETHNSPSAIEPYGGAMTGSGGVFRDILGTGQGAKPIVSTDIFCLADPKLSEKDLPPGCLPPRYILEQVIRGVRDYGNRVGIPTNNGSLHFNNGFKAKPTVAVGSYGILPKKYALKKKIRKNDLILTLGGATGRDGIHGATFSSGAMTSDTKKVSGTAVQIGNAIEEKRLIDCILVLRDTGLIKSITDCGAGGFSSAIGEMAKETGAKVYLERVPIKYGGLKPWELFLSESQERMVIAIDPKNLKQVKDICLRYNVQEEVIGEFTQDKRLRVFYETQPICDLPMEFLHNGYPKRTLIGKTKRASMTHRSIPKEVPLEKAFMAVLSHPTIASKEAIIRQYDHNVKGSNALHPYGGVLFDGPNDGSIVTPILGKPYGLITTHGLNPNIMPLDVYRGSLWAIIEAVSNYTAIGGDIRNAALIDNFIWPFPDSASLSDLDKSVDACSDMARTLKMPFISGKDSLSSTYRYPSGEILKIPPVLLVSVFGKIPDVTKTVSADAKKPGSILILLGKSDFSHMGGSIYSEVTNKFSSSVPLTDIKALPKLLLHLHKAIGEQVILSCHDISEGGIAVALSEMCFGGNMGAEVDLKKISKQTDEHILFNETSGTFLIEVENKKIAETYFADNPYTVIGKTTEERSLSIKRGEKGILHVKIDTLKNVWQKPMKEIFP